LTAEAPDTPPPGEAVDRPQRARAGCRLGRLALIAIGGLALLLTMTLGAVRYGVQTDAGRSLVLSLMNGLPLGGAGRLQVEGLDGDVFGAFRIHRLAVIDAKGPWLEGADLSMRWRPGELLIRRFHAVRIAAGRINILRAPELPASPSRGGGQALPVSVRVDQLQLALETQPAFSLRHGLWDISGRLHLTRKGAADGQVAAQSRLHPGDGMNAAFRIGEGKDVLLRADAVEASGGALSGALGLSPDRRLLVRARVNGTTDRGGLAVTAVSGADQVLAATGQWDKAGARLQGDVNFAASRLTSFIASRAGPAAHLVVQARQSPPPPRKHALFGPRLAPRPASGDLYDIDASVVARDAAIALQGPVNWRQRATSGVNVQVRVADLSRWLPFPKIGATQALGVASGDLKAIDFKGAVTGHQIAEYGYSVAEASGPATLNWSPKALRFQTNLSGTGGAGAGAIPALLGPRPKVDLDLTVSPNLHVLFHTLNVMGSGIKVEAQGGQSLLGGFDFKGSGLISNLAATHPGAKGALSATWSASLGGADLAKRGAGWRIAFDAAARNFASGFADADHLLGPSPTLKAQGVFGDGAVRLDHAELDGAELKTGFKGRLGLHGELGLDGTWSAAGPFEAGPVEIAGRAAGVFQLAGALAAPQIKLGADVASIDLGTLRVTPAHLTLDVLKDATGFSGDIGLTGASRYGPAMVKSAFRLAASGVDLTGLSADAGGVKASGALSLRDGEPSKADLTLDAHAGAFLSAGRLNGTVSLYGAAAGQGAPATNALNARLNLTGADISVPGVPGVLHSLSLQAQGPWAHLPLKISADSVDPLSWRFVGSGLLAQGTGGARTLELSGAGRVRKVDFKTLQPAVLKLTSAARDLHLLVSLGGGQAEASAHMAKAADGVDQVAAKATVTSVTLATLDPDLAGTLSGDLSVDGHGSSLGGALNLTLVGARSRDAPTTLALNGQVHAALSANRLKLAASATNAEGLTSNLDLNLPASAATQPFHLSLDRSQPMAGAFSADGELRPLWDLFIGGGQTLAGRVATHGVLSGTLNNPKLVGEASLANGRFQDISSGLSLQNFTLNADFGVDAINVRQASGVDGHGGTVSGVGAISLDRDGGSTFALKLSKFRLFDNDIGRASVSGAVTVNRAADGHAKLTGALKVDRADIVATTPTPTGVVALDVVEINRPVVEGEEVAATRPSTAPPVALDVTIKAPRGVFVKGKGLNVELSLASHVGGTVNAPELTGVANLVLGSYDFAGKRFDFDQRGSIKLGSSPEDIRLDLSATLQEPTLTAVVRVNGTAARPEIKLSSTPVLPEDEVLSEVLFGSSAAQLGPAQAAELASALASLAGGGGFDVLGRLRQFAGLDRLALGAGVTGTGVAGGKYINDNVYVELIGGGREGPAASVEWRVRKNFSIVSQVGAQGDAQLSVQFRKNY
jgi:translocation and assembly module TamB